jgi:type I restriction enzyme M protein
MPPKKPPVPSTPFAAGSEPLHLSAGYVWAPLRGDWLLARPEEIVRQRMVHRLHTEYGYALDQMRQEVSTQSGRHSPQADIVVARDADALKANRDYILVVELKAESVSILPNDYWQGESYARAVGCEFLVMSNERETVYFRLVVGAPGARIPLDDAPHLDDFRDNVRLSTIRRATKAFTREEFKRVLRVCHDILRDNEKYEPGKAFDEISKVLFVKMHYERAGASNRFTVEYLDEYARFRGKAAAQIMGDLFADTRSGFEDDDLFEGSDGLDMSFPSFERIVRLLERFNLSRTADDIKGLAFESFLGETFRGALGQFFTPRPVVEFMAELLNPAEGSTICDPASGTGGFLIASFDHLRKALIDDIERQKDELRAALEQQATDDGWAAEDLDAKIEAAYLEANKELDANSEDTRMWRLARESIFGCDAELRAARTSKMNMIMHGDGHGGIHHHDGLIDVDGIFPGRFDFVLMNPPFGATVRSDQIVGSTPQSSVEQNNRTIKRMGEELGPGWAASNARLRKAAENKEPILGLFDIGRDPVGPGDGGSKVRPQRSTEWLFIERAIDLVKPGGYVGIILPDGVFNNPSLAWLREYIEARAKVVAVVSLPQEVFASSEATVKTSILFMRRFTGDEVDAWNEAVMVASADAEAEFEARREELRVQLSREVEEAGVTAAFSAREEWALATAEDPKSAQTKAARAALRRVPRDDFKRLKDLLVKSTRLHQRVDVEQEAFLRRRVRQLFDYPVFMAEAANAGITATGLTGPEVPNDLPGILDEFRRFEEDPVSYAEAATAALQEQLHGEDDESGP